MKKQELREGTELLKVTQQGPVELRFEPQDASRTPALNHTVCKDEPSHHSPKALCRRWHSPSQQLDLDTPQEGVAALDDQPGVACAVHGQPDLGRNVHLHGDVQEANETGGDHEAKGRE